MSIKGSNNLLKIYISIIQLKIMKIRYEFIAATIFFISLGFALILVGLGRVDFLSFEFFAIILIPFGAYTIIHGLISKEDTYYYVWGSIIFIVGLSFLFYNIIPLPILIGAVIILITLIGFLSYIKRKS